MAYGFQIEVWGDRALFTRPELSVERMSYDCITPSAARGLIESIYWHPGIKYSIVSRTCVETKLSQRQAIAPYAPPS